MIDISSKNIKNILVIKLRYMGDVLLTTPVLREIRKKLPQAKISVLINDGTESVLKSNTDVDEVIIVDRGLIKSKRWYLNPLQQSSFAWKLRKRNFDTVIDLSWGDRSAILSLLSGARYRVGFDLGTKIRKMAYNVPIEHRMDLHMVDYHCHALKSLGWDVRFPKLVYNVVEEDTQSVKKLMELEGGSIKERFVVIHPGARWDFKSWPLENFVSLADFIQNELGLKVVLVSGPGEMEKINRIKSRMHSKALSFAGKISIPQLGALIKEADLFIGNDSGPMHIASALHTPVIAFFGPTDPNMWGPWGKDHKVFFKGECCGPTSKVGCTWKSRWCMGQIGLEEVVESLKRMVKKSTVGKC